MIPKGYRISALLVFLLICASGSMIGIENQRNYFRSPVSYPITLSGAFGEIRRNHFHSGIDIRTAGVQGKPVYAIADGYVARVFVAPGGFGKALYISHPNGYTSVYGHLKAFAGSIGKWVISRQYRAESFALDTGITVGALKVKKGDLIAWSGNSGSSAGPHLHFEIRDTRTQEIVDPLDFGFKQPDKIQPKITFVKIYPMNPVSMVNFTGNELLIPVTGNNGKYRLRNADTIPVTGAITFGIETSENNDGSLKTGVHALDLMVDGALVFSQNIERFCFSETRYANSLMDYPAFIRSKRKIQRSYIAHNNKLRIYKKAVNNGVVHFSDNRVHQIHYRVTDAFGNQSDCRFYIKSHLPALLGGRNVPVEPRGVQQFSWKTGNRFERDDIRFTVPGDALYEDLAFDYRVSPQGPNTLAAIHHLHDQFVPLHTFCTLSIRADRVPKHLQAKAIIVSVDPGGRIASRGGAYDKGWITAKIREFGAFSIAVDTDPPVIRAVNIFPNKKVTRQTSVLIKISDNLSGIKSYRGTLNGKWILMDYDEKNRLLTYQFDDRIKPGKNLFLLTVTDAAGNASRYEAALIR